MAPIRFRIRLPPKPSFRSDRRYRRGKGPPRAAVRNAPIGRRHLRHESLHAIFREREREARVLVRSPWRWTVVVVTLLHLAVAPVLAGDVDLPLLVVAGLLLAALCPVACFSPHPSFRVTFAALTVIG